MLLIKINLKKDELNNIGDSFYKSISDATISLSKIVVKYIDTSEICIDYIKQLKKTLIKL